MKRFEFKPEDFAVIEHKYKMDLNALEMIAVSDHVNALLDKERARCKRVYGTISDEMDADRMVFLNCTVRPDLAMISTPIKTALLWDVQPIEEVLSFKNGSKIHFSKNPGKDPLKGSDQ